MKIKTDHLETDKCLKGGEGQVLRRHLLAFVLPIKTCERLDISANASEVAVLMW